MSATKFQDLCVTAALVAGLLIALPPLRPYVAFFHIAWALAFLTALYGVKVLKGTRGNPQLAPWLHIQSLALLLTSTLAPRRAEAILAYWGLVGLSLVGNIPFYLEKRRGFLFPAFGVLLWSAILYRLATPS